MRLLRWIACAFAVVTLAACRVNFVVPEGGEVVFPEYPGQKCPAGKPCWVHVVDFHFDATAVAVPAAGYKFKHWKKGNRRFCGGSEEPCRLTTTPFTGEWIPIIQPFFYNPEEQFYLEPVFEKVGSTGGSCSVYVGNTPFCDEGKLPTCEVTRAQGFEISAGMTYEQVVRILGCHGEFSKTMRVGNVILADYAWSDFTKLPYVTIIVQFESNNGGVPRVARVGIY